MLEEIKNITLIKGLVLQAMDDEDKYFALNIDNGDCFELTCTSYFIFDMIQKNNSVNEILAKIIEQYDISLSDATSDLEEMLKNGRELGILDCQE